MLKRNRKILVCLTDEELAVLDRLVESLSLEGSRASKSFVVRYALKKLPYQLHLNDVLHPSSSGLHLQSAC
jgi:Arc/MetJ-type ribon-helix-helix transcriptional regulator